MPFGLFTKINVFHSQYCFIFAVKLFVKRESVRSFSIPEPVNPSLCHRVNAHVPSILFPEKIRKKSDVTRNRGVLF